MSAEFASAQVCLGRVAAHHSMTVEIRTVLADRALHHAFPCARPGRVRVVQRQHNLFELAHIRTSRRRRRRRQVRRSPNRSRPRCSPRATSRREPTDSARRSSAAFMPLVPDASSGGSGVLSQTSAPDTNRRASVHVVVREKHRSARPRRVRAMRGCNCRDQLLAALVMRVRLAGEHDLKRVFRGDRLQPAEIGEQKIRALVGRHAARESQISAGSRPAPSPPWRGNRVRSGLRFAALCASPDGALRNEVLGTKQELRLMAPAGQMAVVQLA